MDAEDLDDLKGQFCWQMRLRSDEAAAIVP